MDVAIVGSGAGGGTVAAALAPLSEDGRRVVVFEKGPRLRDEEFTGLELEMARALYADGGGFLTADGTMTLAFAETYGGSTAVYTGTSLLAPERVIRRWAVPGVTADDLRARSRRYAEQNNVHLLEEGLINENNRLFVEGGERAGYEVEQFPLNLRGCKGSSLCNLGCPNQAKQGTGRVQLPEAERRGVEVVTRAEVRRIEERALRVQVSPKPEGGKGEPSGWEPGEYRIRADAVVVAAGAVGTPALLLRSGFGHRLPRLGEGFTCHPAHILVAEHEEPLTNDLGHPKSFYVDRAAEEGWVLETCMYFPFVTAKNMTGFGPEHDRFMSAFPRLQMILVLACDRASDGNRITVDDEGEPVVEYAFADHVVESLVRGTRASAEIFFAAGARRVHAPSARPPTLERDEMPGLAGDGHGGSGGWPAGPVREALRRRITADHFLPGKISVSAAHLMGGCAMGTGPADSVTDGRGRVHGAPWLRVADASLFPDALEINPYLTIMALADRVAEGILEEDR